MFPGVDGFRWDAGHIIFLGAFFSVAILIAATLISSVWRSVLDQSPKRMQAIRWHSEFKELAPVDRRCRHELNGEIRNRQCPNDLDCRVCLDHPKFVPVHAGCMTEVETHSVVCGLPVPHDRLYHRGHTWARPNGDGTFTVGLDELGARLAGTPESIELPPTGSPVFVNGTAFTVKARGDHFRVLSPVEGEVVETEPGERGWYLKVRVPEAFRTTHLLSGTEAAAWMTKEFERLQLALGMDQAPALADGGTLVRDLTGEYPDLDWSSVQARMFLNS